MTGGGGDEGESDEFDGGGGGGGYTVTGGGIEGTVKLTLLVADAVAFEEPGDAVAFAMALAAAVDIWAIGVKKLRS